MTIDKALETRILRLHFVEHWGNNTIAVQLGVHHTTVDRVLCQAGLPKAERTRRPSIVDPFQPLILETLAQYPRLSAVRLLEMARTRGYAGGSSQFRARVAQLRPKKTPEAYLRLKTLPGEQAQVDWGSFGHVQIGRARRPLMAFVMVLSWSRMIHLRFFLTARMDNFLRGHVGAFTAWNAVPRIALYDNLKSAVLERQGDAIRFHPTLLELAGHYRFEPRPVAPYRGNEKGRVERAIRYVRENFFAGRQWTDVDDLNAQARTWCATTAAARRCPENPELSVAEAFEQERPSLTELPANPFPTEERVEANVGKTPYVRFDLNDYSLPASSVRRTVAVMATLDTVRVLDGTDEIARHARLWGKGEQIEDPEHIAELVSQKRQARYHRGQHRLARAAPSSEAFLILAAARGHRLGSAVAELERLLDRYPAGELELAIAEALAREVSHPAAVQQVLERRREARDEPAPLPVALPDNAQVRRLVVRPSSLAGYDQLSTDNLETDHDNDP